MIKKNTNGSRPRLRADRGEQCLNDAIDGAVPFSDAEEIGDARDQYQDADGKSGHDVAQRHARQPHADRACGGKHEDAEMNIAERCDREDGDEDRDGKRRQWVSLVYSSACRMGNPCRDHQYVWNRGDVDRIDLNCRLPRKTFESQSVGC